MNEYDYVYNKMKEKYGFSPEHEPSCQDCEYFYSCKHGKDCCYEPFEDYREDMYD